MLSSHRVHPQLDLEIDKEESLVEPANYRLVELLVKCKDLQIDSDKNSFDTVCVLFRRQFGQWKEYDRTEILYHDSSPTYCQSFTLEHHLDTYGEIFKFEVYAIINNSNDLDRQLLIGKVEMDFSELIEKTSTLQSSSFPLLVAGFSRPRGHLCITSEVIRPTRSKAIAQCGGHKIKKKSVIGNKKPNAVLEIARSIDAVEYHPVYRTPVCWETSEPRWKPFEISLEKLCNSEKTRSIRLSVYHHSKDGTFLIGEHETNLQKLQAIGNGKSRSLILRKNLLNTGKNSMKEKGQIKIIDFIVEHHYTFLDYARGGCRCKLFVGIDFTLSNGSYNSEESFHKNKDGDKNGNLYQTAIDSVLKMFTPYLNNTQIPVFGFGAKLPNCEEVNHCFPLNGTEGESKTCEDLLRHYFNILPKLKFAGPTYLTPLLNQVALEIQNSDISQQRQEYSFLLIFTDGILNDMKEFKSKLDVLRDLPLSVMIVGIGPMDLDALECFDSREESASTVSKDKMEIKGRQNVHFFHLKSNTFAAKKMVCEGFTTLVSQLVFYMKQRNIVPNDPVVKQMNGTAKIYEMNELRASVKRRKASSKKTMTKISIANCPTCGRAIEDSTDL